MVFTRSSRQSTDQNESSEGFDTAQNLQHLYTLTAVNCQITSERKCVWVKKSNSF